MRAVSATTMALATIIEAFWTKKLRTASTGCPGQALWARRTTTDPVSWSIATRAKQFRTAMEFKAC